MSKTISDIGRIVVFTVHSCSRKLVFIGTSLLYILCRWFSLKITCMNFSWGLGKYAFLLHLPILMPGSPKCLEVHQFMSWASLDHPGEFELYTWKRFEAMTFPGLSFCSLLIRTSSVFLVISCGWRVTILLYFPS